MQPYYQNGDVVLYHGDCREVLPTLAVDSIDLIVTDPPYGVRWQSGHRALQFDAIVGDDSTDAAVIGIGLCVPALRRKRHLYAFGRYDLSGLALVGPSEIIWDKELFAAGDLSIPWATQHETISFYVNNKDGNLNRTQSALSTRLRRGSVIRCRRLNSLQVANHPTEKPVEILRQLIESSSSMYETVLDPFVGSGSTLIAARLESRAAIGVEIEERYCEIAARRLSVCASLFEGV